MPRQCDLCGNCRFEIISSHDRRGEELSTEMCLTCGLVSHRHIPSDEELNNFYTHEYRKLYHGETTPCARRVMRAWKNGERVASRLTPYLPRKAKVLEVGAGIGCTVKALERRGFVASGIEPNQGFQRFAASELGAAVYAASLSQLTPEIQHDVVLLVHVIEHLRSPREALLHLRECLRPGGLLYVECPNLAAPFALPGRMFHFAHIYNFTPRTLARLAEQCGFLVDRRLHDGTNLGLLLRRVEQAPETRAFADPDAVNEVRDALGRYNWLTYHLRWKYLRHRFATLAECLRERLGAGRFVRNILAKSGEVVYGATTTFIRLSPPAYSRSNQAAASSRETTALTNGAT